MNRSIVNVQSCLKHGLNRKCLSESAKVLKNKVRLKIFRCNNTELSGSSLLLCKVSGENKEKSPVDKCHLSMKSAAGYSNATLTEDANENSQADTAVTVDINNEDHLSGRSSRALKSGHRAGVSNSFSLRATSALWLPSKGRL